MTRDDLSPNLIRNMESKQIDVDLSLSILSAYNRGEYDRFKPVEVGELPDVDGSTIVDFTGEPSLTIDAQAVRDRLGGLLPDELLADPAALATATADGSGDAQAGALVFDTEALERIGLLLMPRVAYGVLNGGSATSYADRTKNAGFSSDLLDLLDLEFNRLAELSEGAPKGVTPGFVNPDGSLGPSFLQLKMRSMLITALRSRSAYRRALGDAAAAAAMGRLPSPLAPMFQMTSHQTDDELAKQYDRYRSDPLLADLIAVTGIDPTEVVGAVQPLISAFTHSDEGRPKRVFASAHGRDDEPIALPGGHGQSFAVLKETYQRLFDSGKRFVYLGNVDNLGFLPSPIGVAYLALTGKQAAFDFAYKTPVDVKGGILVRDTDGRLSCADIGPAVSKEDVQTAEESGKPILFNAATGLFDLSFLTRNIDRIARDLPTRITDQDKDAGRYSQAEQVTWEVVGMLDDFLVFSVSKWDRLLAAKLLLETLMTSGLKTDDPAYPTSDDPSDDLRATARKLNEGLTRKLEHDYAMRLEGERWIPIPADELEANWR